MTRAITDFRFQSKICKVFLDVSRTSIEPKRRKKIVTGHRIVYTYYNFKDDHSISSELKIKFTRV